jgi:hypothetical protein
MTQRKVEEPLMKKPWSWGLQQLVDWLGNTQSFVDLDHEKSTCRIMTLTVIRLLLSSSIISKLLFGLYISCIIKCEFLNREALCLTLLSTLSFSQERGRRSRWHGGGPLSPLLNDLVTIITRRKNANEYYTVFILTDGYFSDTERYPPVSCHLYALNYYKLFGKIF